MANEQDSEQPCGAVMGLANDKLAAIPESTIGEQIERRIRNCEQQLKELHELRNSMTLAVLNTSYSHFSKLLTRLY